MADKAVSELIEAERITATDLFVLEQNGTAKKLTGQVLLNWLTAAADGHGGIQSIQKVGTSGLMDTYRITLADTTVFDFVVNNGRGISGIAKTDTSGLVDTYTISYNDGTSGTFTVTNGAKGDKGDNTYTWIKYASQEPTEASHSFGDLPDDWIGIYFGSSSTAPTDWRQYSWYQIKGEKGDTGTPAMLVSSAVEYQASDSGTIIPSGTWSASVPVVAQGKYLWTRTTNTFNTGNPVVAYSVSRIGMDGAGSVSSVAGVSPDPDGDVPLKAESIGALSAAGGDMTGALRMNGQPISGLNSPTDNDQAANKGYVDTVAGNVDVSGKVDKTSVVNNFNTTAEGFVADARALKTLNDNKLSMELLWKNASPNSDFAPQTITVNGLAEYEMYSIVFMAVKGIGKTRTEINYKGYGGVATLSWGDTNEGVHRNYSVSGNSVTFEQGWANKATHNNAMIPYKIFGIKGVTA